MKGFHELIYSSSLRNGAAIQKRGKKIAETKMPDLNAGSLEAAMSMIAGTARSMGVVVED